MSKQLRHYVATNQKVYVPEKSLVCPAHSTSESWNNVNSLIAENEMDFKKEFVEDMFQLLSDSNNAKLGSIEERKCSIDKLKPNDRFHTQYKFLCRID